MDEKEYEKKYEEFCMGLDQQDFDTAKRVWDVLYKVLYERYEPVNMLPILFIFFNDSMNNIAETRKRLMKEREDEKNEQQSEE